MGIKFPGYYGVETIDEEMTELFFTRHHRFMVNPTELVTTFKDYETAKSVAESLNHLMDNIE
jgi:hypothetical protein